MGDTLDLFMSREIQPRIEKTAKEDFNFSLLNKSKIVDSHLQFRELIDSDERNDHLLKSNQIIWVPKDKVKRFVGIGGSTINEIETRSKTKIQIIVNEDDLMRGSEKHRINRDTTLKNLKNLMGAKLPDDKKKYLW